MQNTLQLSLTDCSGFSFYQHYCFLYYYFIILCYGYYLRGAVDGSKVLLQPVPSHK